MSWAIDVNERFARYLSFLTVLFEETEVEVQECLRQMSSARGSLASRWRQYLAEDDNAKRNMLYGKVVSKAVCFGGFGQTHSLTHSVLYRRKSR